jgi:hypothetical protein
MPGDEVPSQAVPQSQGALEVHRDTPPGRAQGGAPEGLLGGEDREAAREDFLDGQAGAGNGDALPQDQGLPGQRALEDQQGPAPGGTDLPEGSDDLDDAGEHGFPASRGRV